MPDEMIGTAKAPIAVRAVTSPTDITGPDYPRRDLFGNVIGKLPIGKEQVGTIPPFDYWNTIQSQYANSPVLMTWIGCIFDCLDQTRNFDNFFDLIWNLDTAQDYGLDVWGRIVGITRTVTTKEWSYFGPMEGQWDPFNQNIFYNGFPDTETVRFDTNRYRHAIIAKAYANICDGSIPSINKMLMEMFPDRGNIWVQDGSSGKHGYFGFMEQQTSSGFNQYAFHQVEYEQAERMTMTYASTFPLTEVEQALIMTSGVMPKPSGVKTYLKMYY